MYWDNIAHRVGWMDPCFHEVYTNFHSVLLQWENTPHHRLVHRNQALCWLALVWSSITTVFSSKGRLQATHGYSSLKHHLHGDIQSRLTWNLSQVCKFRWCLIKFCKPCVVFFFLSAFLINKKINMLGTIQRYFFEYSSSDMNYNLSFFLS